MRSGYIQREEKRESAVTTSPRVFQDDQNDLRVLELGTLGQMVVTVSLSQRLQVHDFLFLPSFEEDGRGNHL